MNIKDLLLSNRSYRRFKQNPVLSDHDLKDLIDSVRLSPSSRNIQALKFIIVKNEAARNKLFPLTAWAGYLKDWDGPNKQEQPTSYIIVLNDQKFSKINDVDVGIASQSILLSAVEKGFGGCLLGSINRPAIKESFKIDDHYDIALIVALGKPGERIFIENVENGDIKYYRDEDSQHHVPKRQLKDLIIKIV